MNVLGVALQVVLSIGGHSFASDTDNEKFSCQEFTRIGQFVVQEHLRFRSLPGAAQRESLFLAMTLQAYDNIEQELKDSGRHDLAASYEKQYKLQLKKAQHQDWFSLCKALEHKDLRLFFLKSFVRSLDPFSNFYLEEEMAVRTSSLTGHFVGVGIGTQSHDDFIEVIEVVEEGPADQLLRVGDRIIKIDGKPVRGLSQIELRQKIRGPMNSQVRFDLHRDDSQHFVVVKRGPVVQKSVSHKWHEGSILEIHIHRFYAQTAEQIDQLIRTNLPVIRGLILNLKDNPGGLLQAARDVVDLFISYGVVVHLRGSYPDEIWASDPKAFAHFPMVVLVNEKTASAGEIVAGALQDYNRAVVVGQKSFGKSCVQSIYNTQERLGTRYGGGLKLTTLWYYLPSGRSVAKLEPDYVLDDPKDHEVKRINMPFALPTQISTDIGMRMRFSTENHPGMARAKNFSPADLSQSSLEIGKRLLKTMQAASQ